jgi:hypothetical protein
MIAVLATVASFSKILAKKDEEKHKWRRSKASFKRF